MIRPVLTLIASSVLVMSCAGYKAVTQAPVSEEQALVNELDESMQTAEQELDQIIQATDRPDCQRVCKLRRNICELASRICLISEQHPEKSKIQQKCQDAIRRCERARARVSGSCQCPGPV